MKIGILTFHCAHNYGAVLQVYALQEHLKELGFDVEIIDYRPDYLTTQYKIFSLKRLISKRPKILIQRITNEIFTLNRRISRHKAFSSFILKKFNLSVNVNKRRIPENYDLYIIGSDQVWNPRITQGLDDVFFGFFDTKQFSKKITYAVSMADTDYLSKNKDYITNALENFNALSVREELLVKELTSFTNKNIENVLDPTLIVKKEIWNKILKKPVINNKYVLVYEVKKNSKTSIVANKIAKEINGQVIYLKAFVDLKRGESIQDTASPEDFLGWIKYAECIITTSFHAAVFSIIFKKPFYTIKLDDALDNRSTSLLERINLNERIVYNEDNLVYSEIDYKAPYKKLNALKENSLHFLNSNLSTDKF